MNHSTILKSLILSVAFALCINVASAQKNTKTDKSQPAAKASQTATTDATAQEAPYTWVYSVATVMSEGNSFTIKFEESRTEDRNSRRVQEMGMKMQDAAKAVTTETDLLNMMAKQKLELISVTNHPGKEGKLMKYYFRTKVEN